MGALSPATLTVFENVPVATVVVAEKVIVILPLGATSHTPQVGVVAPGDGASVLVRVTLPLVVIELSALNANPAGRVSDIFTLVMVTVPVFCTVIIQDIASPLFGVKPGTPFPFVTVLLMLRVGPGADRL